jgi:predicted dehydrogenase
MVDAARASKRKLVIGFQYRYSPPAQVIKRYVNEGNFGEVLFARVQALRRRGIPSWGVFGRKDLQGGGPLIDIGVHAIELAHYLMGSPRAVSASASMFTYLGDKAPTAIPPWGDWDYKTYTVEDLAIGFVRFGNGACMIVESSFAAHIDQDIFNVTIMGEKGGASWSPLKIYKDEAGVMVNVEPTFVGKYDAFERKMQNWIAYVRGEGGTEAPGEAGVMVQKILDGLYRSSERAKEVSIK